jgi:hypothetical protein
MTDTMTQTGFGTGRAFKYAATILKRDYPKILLFSALFIGLPDVAMTYLSKYVAKPGAGYADPNAWVVLAVNLVVSMLGEVALQAAVSRGALGDLDGRRAASDDTPFGGLRDCLALAALGLVTSLGILGGFILLVIPGIILSLAWMVAVPAMVTERLGVLDSIRRSNKLTGEQRGTIFGLSVAVGLVGFVVGWLVQLIASAVANPIVNEIIDPAMQTLTGVVNALLAVAIYHELRRSKEGTSTERLAAVFA